MDLSGLNANHTRLSTDLTAVGAGLASFTLDDALPLAWRIVGAVLTLLAVKLAGTVWDIAIRPRVVRRMVEKTARQHTKEDP